MNTVHYAYRPLHNAVISLELALDDRCKERKETYFAVIDPFPVKTKSKPQGKGHGIKLLTKYM